jgi:hypothetical protein
MAMAGSGVSLNWGGACWGDVPLALPASWKMTCSFMIEEEVSDYINFDTFIEGVSETGTIPDWWKMSVVGDCRYYSSGTTVAIGHAAPEYTLGACQDPFLGGASGGGGYGYLTPTQIQIEAVYTIAAGTYCAGDVETYNNTVTVRNGKTTGTGKCLGCSEGMVFGLYESLIGLESGPVIRLTEPFPDGNQCIVWQRSFAGQPCNAPVEARNTTWGQVKSLYR